MIDVHTHMTYYWDHAPGTRPWTELGTLGPAVTVFLAQENARKTLEVQHLVLALQQQVVKTQENARPFGERALAPRHLRRVRTLHGEFQIRHRPRRDGADGAARVRRSHRNCLVRPIGERRTRAA